MAIHNDRTQPPTMTVDQVNAILRGPVNCGCPEFMWKGRWLACEGQRHSEGGKAHSAITSDGLLMWWEYGNGRMAKVLRPDIEQPAARSENA